ncbi:unnamed protein product [Eruca vesicaria subsp. sativa]|uniref:MEKHLA domain-containing protein n=1 Tax=Eruca vesicaria subsp. sativa TaxID=29727 RepID=A0ABC8IXN0_ERUVS|nr:unnamed protein product [Eruca vesicaria subsp. sativa]
MNLVERLCAQIRQANVAGICLSTMGRHVAYEQAVAWKLFAAAHHLKTTTPMIILCIVLLIETWRYLTYKKQSLG